MHRCFVGSDSEKPVAVLHHPKNREFRFLPLPALASNSFLASSDTSCTCFSPGRRGPARNEGLRGRGSGDHHQPNMRALHRPRDCCVPRRVYDRGGAVCVHAPYSARRPRPLCGGGRRRGGFGIVVANKIASCLGDPMGSLRSGLLVARQRGFLIVVIVVVVVGVPPPPRACARPHRPRNRPLLRRAQRGGPLLRYRGRRDAHAFS